MRRLNTVQASDSITHVAIEESGFAPASATGATSTKP